MPTLKLICCPAVSVRLTSRAPTASKAQRSVAARRCTSSEWLPGSAFEPAVTAATDSSVIEAA